MIQWIKLWFTMKRIMNEIDQLTDEQLDDLMSGFGNYKGDSDGSIRQTKDT